MLNGEQAISMAGCILLLNPHLLSLWLEMRTLLHVGNDVQFDLLGTCIDLQEIVSTVQLLYIKSRLLINLQQWNSTSTAWFVEHSSRHKQASTASATKHTMYTKQVRN